MASKNTPNNPYAKAKHKKSPPIPTFPIVHTPSPAGSVDKPETQKKATPVAKQPNDDFDSVNVLCLADNTVAGYSAAVSKANILNKFFSYPLFENMTMTFLAGDNLEFYLVGLITFCVTHLFHHKFKENFEPIDPKSKKMWMLGSIFQFIGTYKEALRKKFPKHPEWPRSRTDNPSWYTTACKEGKTIWIRNYQTKWKNNPDLVFGSVRTRAIYG